MADAPIPANIAATPLGERLRFLLDYLRDAGREFTDEGIAANFVASVDGVRALLGGAQGVLTGFTLIGIRSPDSTAVSAVLERSGQTWDIGVRIEPDAPHRISGISRAERMPGVTIRAATEADAALLRDIELRTPIRIGDVEVVYDRGEDYFAPERLMGNVLTHVVEMNGRPVGLTAWVVHDIRVRGSVKRAAYKHRQRLLPEARGQGIRHMQDFASLEVGPRDVLYTFAAAGNETVRRAYGEPGWSVSPERLVIDAQENQGRDLGRPATPADIDRVIELLNRTHASEEMFVPYTAETLTARLVREPEMYSWPNFRLGERAVVGVWAAHLGVIRTAESETTTDDRALVLDYGYEQGAEGELVDLLQAECSVLSQSGCTELAVFMTPQASAYAQLAALAKRTEPYLMWLAVPPPADLAERGIYVDQLYF